jgi:4-alpha-glucanotransferase
MPFPRSSGILLHPTSLPSRHGIGDFGAAALEFIDFLVAADQRYWQVLPLGPTGYGNSPYMCYSAMAGNPLLISLDLLAADGLISPELLEGTYFATDYVDYDNVILYKLPLIRQAAQAWQQQATPADRASFAAFAQQAPWLKDYALFMALKEAHGGTSWHTWETGLAQRHPATLAQWREQLAETIWFHEFAQYIFHQQWTNLKQAANQHGVYIIGDIPIYVAHDSADVWAHPQYFQLDPKTGEPAQMAGVPPDYFSVTGQLWGNPIYNWDSLAKNRFDWWIERFRALLDYVDIIRVDHFRGFQAYWQVPLGEETAINGEWVNGPSASLFEILAEELGQLPILAEDLGDISPDVLELRDKFAFPGMKILQFAFGGGADNPFLPFNYDRNFVVYTGTHDNDTTMGWFSQLGDYERYRVESYLGCISGAGIHWDFVRLAWSSTANQAIAPLQDLLGLDTHARMNFPGKPTGNWGWRYWPNALTPDLCERLAFLTQLCGRSIPRPQPQPPEPEETAAADPVESVPSGLPG